MSRKSLEEHIWKNLGPRKFAAGRVRVARITRQAIRRWSYSPDAQAIAATVEADEKNDVGMGIILSFVLSALVNEIVHLLAKWWMQSHANRCLLMGYQREMPDEQ